MSLWIRAEALAGDNIEEVCREMESLANRVHVGVRLDFNGVSLHMPCGGSAEVLAREFASVVELDQKVKLAFGYLK